MTVDYGTNFNGNMARPKTGMLPHTLGPDPVVIGHCSHGLNGKMWGTGRFTEGISAWLMEHCYPMWQTIRREEYPSGPAVWHAVSGEVAIAILLNAPDEIYSECRLHLTREQLDRALELFQMRQPRIPYAETEEGEGPEVGFIENHSGTEVLACSRYGRGYVESLFKATSRRASSWSATDLQYALRRLVR